MESNAEQPVQEEEPFDAEEYKKKSDKNLALWK